MIEIIKEILKPENIWCLFPLFAIISSELMVWFIASVLSLLNADAVYDVQHKRILLELAQTSKVWKRVIKILGIKEN